MPNSTFDYPRVSIVFDYKRRASDTVKGVVSVEVLYHRERKRINTGVRVYKNQWDDRHGVVRRIDCLSLNDTIRRTLKRVTDYVDDLKEQRREFSFAGLSRHLEADEATAQLDNSFIDFVRSTLDNRADIRESTRKSHGKLLSILDKYNKIISFADLTRDNILAFDSWLKSRNIMQATVHTYHKLLKVYIYEAIRQGLMTDNPYVGFKVKRGNPSKRKYLSEADLAKLRAYTPPTQSLCAARDLFLMQCYTGLAYADLTAFDFSKVQKRGDKLVLRDTRVKSGEDYYIVLLSPAVEILDRYNFVLPLITNQQYNLRLKVVGECAGISTPLTTHMGRHTFAVYCLNHGIAIETLAKMMGHTDIKTTQLYAKVLNSSVESAFDKLEESLK